MIDGKGLTVYPGLIDMGSTVGLDMPSVPRADNPQTTEDVERVKADYLLRAQLRAADHVNPNAAALAKAASAGITSILATPSGDAIRGQSALVNSALPGDEPQIGAVADERRGAIVVRTPVALHVTFSERPAGGSAYPNSLMGVIAFVRQAFLDAQHYQAAADCAAKVVGAGGLLTSRRSKRCSRRSPVRLPVAFEAQRRARDLCVRWTWPGASSSTRSLPADAEADQVAADLKAANARVIVSLNFPKRPETLAPDADESLSTLRARANAPKTRRRARQGGRAVRVRVGRPQRAARLRQERRQGRSGRAVAR